MNHRSLLTGVLPFLVAFAQPVQAVDFNWSGFGTLGYVESDESRNYQRFINDSGTIKRDSVLGGQMDVKFDQHWGATVQARLAPSDHYESRWQAALTWAFVSWRPSDDWLIRLGKIRLPLMLNTENLDVGATFDLARLPQEVYSISPMTDVWGVSVSKSWLAETMEWNLEAYTGRADPYWRYYGREIRDGNPTPGSWFVPLDVASSGLVLTARDIGNTFRVGIHEVNASRVGAQSQSEIPYRQVTPSFGFYDMLSGSKVDNLRIPVQTMAASISLPAEVKVTAEYARMKVDSASEGLTRWGAYLAVSKRIGAWTPYVYYAKTKSSGGALDLYQDIDASAERNRRGSTLYNYQKMQADIVSPYDQWTGALGTSFRLTPRSIFKAEWAHTQTGVASNFLDAPSGGNSGDKRFNIFSLSYNFTF